MNKRAFCVGLFLSLSALLLCPCTTRGRQSPSSPKPGNELRRSPAFTRLLRHSTPEVEQALLDLEPTFRGQLPTLEGFVEAPREPFDRFKSPHFECTIRLTPQEQTATLVEVRASITIWYVGKSISSSGYRELTSNGRLETDLLDRISAYLDNSPAPDAGMRPDNAPEPAPVNLAEASPSAAREPLLRPSRSSLTDPNHVSGIIAAFPLPDSPGTVSTGSEDLKTLQLQREQADKKAAAMAEQVRNLEQILHSQSHPSDLVVVSKSGTRVMAKPSETSPILMSAEKDDEFQILDRNASWVHVLISGVSRGWIRASELVLPEGIVSTGEGSPPRPEQASPAFRVVREEMSTFPGSWAPLAGKNVKIIWAAPLSDSPRPAPALVKRDFARMILSSQANNDPALDAAPLAGVVLVFDSADGGQISATLQSLKLWWSGRIPESQFWRQCSIDPPDLLHPLM